MKTYFTNTINRQNSKITTTKTNTRCIMDNYDIATTVVSLSALLVSVPVPYFVARYKCKNKEKNVRIYCNFVKLRAKF